MTGYNLSQEINSEYRINFDQDNDAYFNSKILTLVQGRGIAIMGREFVE